MQIFMNVQLFKVLHLLQHCKQQIWVEVFTRIILLYLEWCKLQPHYFSEHVKSTL